MQNILNLYFIDKVLNSSHTSYILNIFLNMGIFPQALIHVVIVKIKQFYLFLVMQFKLEKKI